MSRSRPPTISLSSPGRFVLACLAIMFVVELGVMSLLPILLPPDASTWLIHLVDSSLLVLITLPFIWFLVVRPVRRTAFMNQAKYAAIVEGAADGIITIDERGIVESFNPAAERIFRYGAEEVVGKNVSELIPSPERERHDEYLRNYVQGGPGTILNMRREVVARRRDDSTFPVELHVSEVRLAGRRLFTGIVSDISERRLMELALAEQFRTAELAADVGAALTRGDMLRSMLHRCAEAMVCHLDAAFARIWTLNEAEGVLELQASAGLYTHLDGAHRRVALGALKIGWIAERREPHLTNDVLHDPRIGDREWARREGLVAFAGYPLIVGDRLVGVVALFARRPLSDMVLRALGSVADEIALGIERFRAVGALRESERKYADLVQQSPDGIVALDTAGRILSVNPAAEWLSGIPAQDQYGKHFAELGVISEASLKEAEAAFAEAKAGREPPPQEVTIIKGDGSHLVVEACVRPIIRDGNVASVQVCLRDITERRRTEQRIRLQSTALEAASSGIVITDGEGRVCWVNPAFTCLTGYSQDEVRGQNLRLLKSGRHDQAFYREMWETILAGQIWHGELINVRKNGSLYSEEMVITPVRGERGEITHFVAIKRDVSERKRAEEERMRLLQLEQERKSLKAAVRSLERVLGVVGHELRTPLAGIRAMAEYLLLDDARNSAEWDTFVRGINDEIIRMTGLVNDLLEAARLNSGTVHWNWSRSFLAGICNDALDAIRPLVDHAKVKLTARVDPPDLALSGDDAAIRRLLVNLLNNAHDHTPEGEIGVRADGFFEDGKAWVRIQVCDNGKGMAPEVAERLGVAFALNSGMVGESHVRGSGLGLAICRGIVAAHGGNIAVDTRPGRGTTVTVLLRADLTEPQPVRDAAQIVSKVQT